MTGPIPAPTRTALLCVDVQVDFCEGGALAVPGGDDVAERLAAHLRSHRGAYALVVASRDWHVDPGSHWSDEPDFVTSWPVHCRAGSPGAALHPAMAAAAREGLVDLVVDKGQYDHGYSAFTGVAADGRGLAGALREAGVTDLLVAGLATDHCVRASALGGREAGLATTVLTSLVAGVDAAASARALAEVTAAGGRTRPE